MDTSQRQEFLESAEAAARDQAYWIGELGEFGRFDVSAAYASGNAALTVERVVAHIEELTRRRLKHLSSENQNELHPEILARLTRLEQVADNGPFNDAEAQNAVRCFFDVLYGRIAG